MDASPASPMDLSLLAGFLAAAGSGCQGRRPEPVQFKPAAPALAQSVKQSFNAAALSRKVSKVISLWAPLFSRSTSPGLGVALTS
jgi:hypothetical protein